MKARLIRFLAGAALLLLGSGCGRPDAQTQTAAATGASANRELQMPPAQPRPADLGPSVKWVPESARYQQMRREAWRQDRDFAARVDQSPRRSSRDGRYVVEVLERPQPLVGAFQTWLIRLHTAQGEPLQAARLSISGGMPEHGHGLPSKPQIEATGVAGQYRVSGLQFGMPGWWEIHLYISDGRQDDSVTLNVVAG